MRSVSSPTDVVRQVAFHLSKGDFEEVLSGLHEYMRAYPLELLRSRAAQGVIYLSMARAAVGLEDHRYGGYCRAKAVRKVPSLASHPNLYSQYTIALLIFAESLAHRNQCPDAMAVADIALESILQHPVEYFADEVVEPLRRYANIAAASGLVPTAQYAFTLGLILLQSANGIGSQIASDAMLLGQNFGFGAVGKVGGLLMKEFKCA